MLLPLTSGETSSFLPEKSKLSCALTTAKLRIRATVMVFNIFIGIKFYISLLRLEALQYYIDFLNLQRKN